MGGREAAAYFTGQDRVNNKTTADSTPRVLQGLSMTPSFPLSPQPGSTSPEGLPTPGAVAFGFYANNCLAQECFAARTSVLGRMHSSTIPQLSWPSQSAHLHASSNSGARRWEAGKTVLIPLPALGWQLPAGGGLGTTACVNGLVVLSGGGGWRGGGCRCGVASTARPTTL